MTALLQVLPMTFPRATIAATGSAVSASDTSSYNFSSISIGAASPLRQVVVAVGAQRGGTGGQISVLSIGGISATKLGAIDNGTEYVELWAASVPTGTTATIAVSWTTSQANCGIAVAALYGARTSVHQILSDTVGNPSTANLAVPANGVALAYAFQRSNSAASISFGNMTSSGIAAAVESGSAYHGAASTQYIAPQSALAVSATSSAAGVRDPVAIFASWSPL